METIISLNNKERQQLCQLLDDLSKVVAGPLKRDVLQSKMIYCKVKRNLIDVAISGSNITKLSKLLLDVSAVRNFENRSNEMYNLIQRKKAENEKHKL